MRKILVVTTGTRDVQIRLNTRETADKGLFTYEAPGKGRVSLSIVPHDNHPGTFLLSSVRKGCLQLAEDYPSVKDNLLFPLIDQAVRYVLSNTGNIDLLLFVVTDQEKENVQQRFKEKDTINLPDLAEKHLRDSFPGAIADFDTYEVYERLTDIDLWYGRFEIELSRKNLIVENRDEAEVWFMPQGGLDQVNQALTLRLIEHYPDLKLIQIAEDCEPRQLEFPKKFLQNLTRAKALEMAKYFRFSQVRLLNLSQDRDIDLLSELGNTLMRLDHSSLVSMSMKEPWLSAKRKILVVRTIFGTWVEKVDPQKMNMWVYLTAKVNAFCSNTEELLWRLFTLYEQMLKPYVAKKINWGNTAEEHPFTNFNRCIERDRELHDHLRKNNFRQKVLVPGSSLFSIIMEYYNIRVPEEIERINAVLSSIRDKRNMLVHQGRGISSSMLDAELSGSNTSIEEFFAGHLDPYFGISGFGLLGELRDEIMERLKPG